MELLQKITKKYLPLSFVIFMMMMGVTSCESCGSTSGVENTDKLALRIQDNKTTGSETKRGLIIKVSAPVKPADFKFVAKLVSKSNDNTATGTVILTVNNTDYQPVEIGKDFEMDLHTFLKLDADSEIQEGEEKPVGIEFKPIGTIADLELIFEIKDSEGKVVAKQPIEWTKQAPAGKEFAVNISDLGVDNKVSVTITAKADQAGNAQNVEVGDLGNLRVNVKSNASEAAAAGQFATINNISAGDLQFEAADIQDVVKDTKTVIGLVKTFTVVPGTNPTELTLQVTKGGASVGASRIITVSAKPATLKYELAITDKKLVADQKEFKLVLTRSDKKKLEDADLANIKKVAVEKTQGTNITLGGTQGGEVAVNFIKDTNNPTQAKTQLTIEDKGDIQGAFKVKLVGEKGVVVSDKVYDLTWTNGADVKIEQLVADHYNPDTKTFKVTLTNNGEIDIADQAATLKFVGKPAVIKVTKITIGTVDTSLDANNAVTLPALGKTKKLPITATVDLGGQDEGKVDLTFTWDRLASSKTLSVRIAKDAELAAVMTIQDKVIAELKDFDRLVTGTTQNLPEANRKLADVAKQVKKLKNTSKKAVNDIIGAITQAYNLKDFKYKAAVQIQLDIIGDDAKGAVQIVNEAAGKFDGVIGNIKGNSITKDQLTELNDSITAMQAAVDQAKVALTKLDGTDENQVASVNKIINQNPGGLVVLLDNRRTKLKDKVDGLKQQVKNAFNGIDEVAKVEVFLEKDEAARDFEAVKNLNLTPITNAITGAKQTLDILGNFADEDTKKVVTEMEAKVQQFNEAKKAAEAKALAEAEKQRKAEEEAKALAEAEKQRKAEEEAKTLAESEAKGLVEEVRKVKQALIQQLDELATKASGLSNQQGELPKLAITGPVDKKAKTADDEEKIQTSLVSQVEALASKDEVQALVNEIQDNSLPNIVSNLKVISQSKPRKAAVGKLATELQRIATELKK